MLQISRKLTMLSTLQSKSITRFSCICRVWYTMFSVVSTSRYGASSSAVTTPPFDAIYCPICRNVLVKSYCKSKSFILTSITNNNSELITQIKEDILRRTNRRTYQRNKMHPALHLGPTIFHLRVKSFIDILLPRPPFELVNTRVLSYVLSNAAVLIVQRITRGEWDWYRTKCWTESAISRWHHSNQYLLTELVSIHNIMSEWLRLTPTIHYLVSAWIFYYY